MVQIWQLQRRPTRLGSLLRIAELNKSARNGARWCAAVVEAVPHFAARAAMSSNLLAAFHKPARVALAAQAEGAASRLNRRRRPASKLLWVGRGLATDLIQGRG